MDGAVTRFAVLDDERKLILGRDLLGLFEPGFVYGAYEILGEIVMKKLGPYKEDRLNIKANDVNMQVLSGDHLLVDYNI